VSQLQTSPVASKLALPLSRDVMSKATPRLPPNAAPLADSTDAQAQPSSKPSPCLTFFLCSSLSVPLSFFFSKSKSCPRFKFQYQISNFTPPSWTHQLKKKGRKKGMMGRRSSSVQFNSD